MTTRDAGWSEDPPLMNGSGRRMEVGPDQPLRVTFHRPKVIGRDRAQIGGPQLRELRRARRLTQKELAARCGISEATIGRVEGSLATTCHPETVARLAAPLGARPAALRPAAGPARAVVADVAAGALDAAFGGAGVEATVVTNDLGLLVELAVTPANVVGLVRALALALNITARTRS